MSLKVKDIFFRLAVKNPAHWKEALHSGRIHFDFIGSGIGMSRKMDTF
jgi:hypothetical protein